ncbi:MAG: hypothetical protein HY681_11115 [Chloroflexi bacterium]|nr:hypothetical protein [Chloroflexota bacterium]
MLHRPRSRFGAIQRLQKLRDGVLRNGLSRSQGAIDEEQRRKLPLLPLNGLG